MIAAVKFEWGMMEKFPALEWLSRASSISLTTQLIKYQRSADFLISCAAMYNALFSVRNREPPDDNVLIKSARVSIILLAD
jgi:hypothetical protein